MQQGHASVMYQVSYPAMDGDGFNSSKVYLANYLYQKGMPRPLSAVLLDLLEWDNSLEIEKSGCWIGFTILQEQKARILSLGGWGKWNI
jgi:hypothetical protein